MGLKIQQEFIRRQEREQAEEQNRLAADLEEELFKTRIAVVSSDKNVAACFNAAGFIEGLEISATLIPNEETRKTLVASLRDALAQGEKRAKEEANNALRRRMAPPPLPKGLKKKQVA